MFNKELVILMTATIDPGGYADQCSRNTVEERLKDYLFALEFWLNYNDPRIIGIVFCENSGYPLEKHLKKIYKKNYLEILRFDGNTKPVDVHYGYSELGIIDYAIKNSRLISNSKYFVKITGRLIFPNLSGLINSLNESFLVAIDCSKKKENKGGDIIARTQLAIFEKGFYMRYFYERRYEMVGHYSHIEEWWATKFFTMKNVEGICLRWPIECNPIGIDAFSSKSYTRTTLRIKYMIRGIARKLIPSWWL